MTWDLPRTFAAKPDFKPEKSSLEQNKNATPEPASLAEVGGEAFQGALRPNTLAADYSSDQLHDHATQGVLQLGALTANMTITSGSVFWDQWQPRFLTWAFPFSLPTPFGGPDFPNKKRDRRIEEAPELRPVPHLRALAQRVESSIRNSWDWYLVCGA